VRETRGVHVRPVVQANRGGLVVERRAELYGPFFVASRIELSQEGVIAAGLDRTGAPRNPGNVGRGPVSIASDSDGADRLVAADAPSERLANELPLVYFSTLLAS